MNPTLLVISTGHLVVRYLSEYGSENVMGADNQQERLDARWIVGFVEGEGCFHVAINKMSKMHIGYQVLPEFRVVQHLRDVHVLHMLKSFFGCGSIVVNHGDRMEYRARGIKDLTIIVSFFKRHTMYTSKQKNFLLFSEVIQLMKNKQHLNTKGLHKIVALASSMNNKVQRYLESSETARQTG